MLCLCLCVLFAALQILQAADYLGCELCACTAAEAASKLLTSTSAPRDIDTVVRVLLNNLAAAGSTTKHTQTLCVRALCNLAKVDLLQELHQHDAFKTLFGDAHKILVNEKLRLLFCALPRPAIKAWGSMDDLVLTQKTQ